MKRILIAIVALTILITLAACQSGKNFAQKSTFFGIYTNITDSTATVFNPKIIIGYGSEDIVYIEKGTKAEIARQYYDVDTLSIDGNIWSTVKIDSTDSKKE